MSRTTDNLAIPLFFPCPLATDSTYSPVNIKNSNNVFVDRVTSWGSTDTDGFEIENSKVAMDGARAFNKAIAVFAKDKSRVWVKDFVGLSNDIGVKATEYSIVKKQGTNDFDATTDEIEESGGKII